MWQQNFPQSKRSNKGKAEMLFYDLFPWVTQYHLCCFLCIRRVSKVASWGNLCSPLWSKCQKICEHISNHYFSVKEWSTDVCNYFEKKIFFEKGSREEILTKMRCGVKGISVLFKENIRYLGVRRIGNQHRGEKEDILWKYLVGLAWEGIHTKRKEWGCCFLRNLRQGRACGYRHRGSRIFYGGKIEQFFLI